MLSEITDSIPEDLYFTLSKKLSVELDTYLCTFPWEVSGHRLDWQKIDTLTHISINFENNTLEEDRNIFNKFNCFSKKYTIFLYSAFAPCLLIETNFVANNFDLFADLHHAVYFFSIENFINLEEITPIKNYFLELDPVRDITGTI